MSTNDNLINTLKAQIDTAKRNLAVIEAINSKEHYIVVTMQGSDISALASPGLDMHRAVASLAASIRSFSEQINDHQALEELFGIIKRELTKIEDRVTILSGEPQTQEEPKAGE